MKRGDMAHSDRHTSDILAHRPFQVLNRRSCKKRLKDLSPCEEGKEDPGLTDEELFLREMKKVREIREFREMAVQPKRGILPVRRPRQDENPEEVLEEIVRGERPIHLPHTQEYVEWFGEDCNPDIVRQLHEGTFSVQDSLDLHGFTLDEAEKEIETLMRTSLRRGLRCLKIIHGRGLRSRNGPVLKKLIVHLLSTRYRKRILAFVSARQCDGGLGALYILLRSKT
jgi:DNA-nicking Smr family endonuclease